MKEDTRMPDIKYGFPSEEMKENELAYAAKREADAKMTDDEKNAEWQKRAWGPAAEKPEPKGLHTQEEMAAQTEEASLCSASLCDEKTSEPPRAWYQSAYTTGHLADDGYPQSGEESGETSPQPQTPGPLPAEEESAAPPSESGAWPTEPFTGDTWLNGETPPPAPHNAETGAWPEEDTPAEHWLHSEEGAEHAQAGRPTPGAHAPAPSAAAYARVGAPASAPSYGTADVAAAGSREAAAANAAAGTYPPQNRVQAENGAAQPRAQTAGPSGQGSTRVTQGEKRESVMPGVNQPLPERKTQTTPVPPPEADRTASSAALKAKPNAGAAPLQKPNAASHKAASAPSRRADAQGTLWYREPGRSSALKARAARVRAALDATPNGGLVGTPPAPKRRAFVPEDLLDEPWDNPPSRRPAEPLPTPPPDDDLPVKAP